MTKLFPSPEQALATREQILFECAEQDRAPTFDEQAILKQLGLDDKTIIEERQRTNKVFKLKQLVPHKRANEQCQLEIKRRQNLLEEQRPELLSLIEAGQLAQSRMEDLERDIEEAKTQAVTVANAVFELQRNEYMPISIRTDFIRVDGIKHRLEKEFTACSTMVDSMTKTIELVEKYESFNGHDPAYLDGLEKEGQEVFYSGGIFDDIDRENREILRKIEGAKLCLDNVRATPEQKTEARESLPTLESQLLRPMWFERNETVIEEDEKGLPQAKGSIAIYTANWPDWQRLAERCKAELPQRIEDLQEAKAALEHLDVYGPTYYLDRLPEPPAELLAELEAAS